MQTDLKQVSWLPWPVLNYLSIMEDSNRKADAKSESWSLTHPFPQLCADCEVNKPNRCFKIQEIWLWVESAVVLRRRIGYFVGSRQMKHEPFLICIFLNTDQDYKAFIENHSSALFTTTQNTKADKVNPFKNWFKDCRVPKKKKKLYPAIDTKMHCCLICDKDNRAVQWDKDNFRNGAESWIIQEWK